MPKEGSTYYEVESIVGKKTTKYLIKWSGYSANYNTWEPIQNLNCSDLIREYEESEKLQSRSTRSSQASKKRKEALEAETTSEEQEAAVGGAADDDWEGLVSCIETIEKKKGKLYASVCWYYSRMICRHAGHTTAEEVADCNQKCPQKMLAFYESRLKFK